MRATLALLVFAAACQDDITTVFPDGLEPLEANTAPAPQAGAGIEELRTVSSGSDEKVVHGRGLVLAEPGVVWAVVKDAERLASTCATDRHAVMLGVEPQYEYGFQIHYEVDQVITVAWDELWRFGTVEGTPEAPTLAMVRYQKVFGSDLITLIEGSIVVRAGEAGATELEFIEHLAAFGGSIDQMKQSMTQRYRLIVAAAHGQPRPTGCP
ncbi:MAG: hypothetical protein R3B06_20775 [Kofleriaceae bacterium]